MSKKDDATSLPNHPLSRGKIIAKTITRLGTQYAGHRVKRVLGQSNIQQDRKKMATTTFEGLSQLKGIALKFAQLLSMEKELLPVEFQEELAQAHYQAPTLNRAIVRKAIQNEFGATPEQIFMQFDTQAFAAASLGQVHQATLHSGEKVAVKIQYPGIERSVQTDLRIIETMILPWMKNTIVSHLFHEMKNMMQEELDYQHELAQTQSFAKLIPFQVVKIPKVYPDYCGHTIITTSLLQGHHLDAFLARSPSQATINRIAQRLYNTVMYCCFHLRKFHADPNPGNYMFWDNGDIGILDFGCIKRFDTQQADTLIQMWNAVHTGDFAQIKQAYADFGYANSHLQSKEDFHRYFDAHYEQLIAPFDQWMSEPLQDETFDLKKHPHFCNRGSQLFRNAMANPKFKIFNASLMYFDRTWIGLFRIFEKMGAEIKVRNPAYFQNQQILKEIEDEM
ncbi:MAG: AarF/ABC1/UbiB kinase family protein [Deltaproteobacteria bacterium]|nr:AarF/ABC1/UbiB kinase family protein [Deltaproteobacteria bacterium]